MTLSRISRSAGELLGYRLRSNNVLMRKIQSGPPLLDLDICVDNGGFYAMSLCKDIEKLLRYHFLQTEPAS